MNATALVAKCWNDWDKKDQNHTTTSDRASAAYLWKVLWIEVLSLVCFVLPSICVSSFSWQSAKHLLRVVTFLRYNDHIQEKNHKKRISDLFAILGNFKLSNITKHYKKGFGNLWRNLHFFYRYTKRHFKRKITL